MPSLEHEAWLLLFRNRPSLAVELLRDVLDVHLLDHEEARVESADLGEITPTEYRADLVVVLRRAGAEEPVAAVVLEVQLRSDETKRYSWPLYLMSLRARLRCPVCLLVVTPSPAVARWCRRPIELGPPGLVFTPQVLGPEAVPAVRDEEQAQKAPELAVLSAMAHGRGDPQTAEEVARAAIAAATGLPKEQGVLYFDLVLASLGPAAKRALEELVSAVGYTYQSDFAKKYYGQGQEAGLAIGEARALLKVLEGRDLSPSAAQRARIEGASRDELEGWLLRVTRAATVEELLEG
jgi:hypothetical protein